MVNSIFPILKQPSTRSSQTSSEWHKIQVIHHC